MADQEKRAIPTQTKRSLVNYDLKHSKKTKIFERNLNLCSGDEVDQFESKITVAITPER